MAAYDFTYTGTFTPLTTNLAANTENVPSIKNEHYSDFEAAIPEIGLIVQMIADAYGCQHWVACSFLKQQLISYMSDVPSTGAGAAA